MREWSPRERELFEGPARSLFEKALGEDGLSMEACDLLAGPDAEALKLLLDVGLLLPDPSVRQLRAVDPSTVQSRVVTPMSNRGSELLAESSQWASAFGDLAHAWRRSPHTSKGPLTELHGDALHSYIASAVADAEDEILTAQPQSVRDKPSLEAAMSRDVAALKRGVTIRTLYQHAARRNSMTCELVSNLSEMGAQYRTLDEFFNRMIVIDRQLAIIPGAQSLRTALAIREPSLVAYLVDIFERSWSRGRPFSNTDSSVLKRIAAEQRAMTIRMLIEGHADPASAKRLGVSPRTYASYISDLKQEYDAQTRFQLGYQMGLLAVSGTEAETARDDAR